MSRWWKCIGPAPRACVPCFFDSLPNDLLSPFFLSEGFYQRCQLFNLPSSNDCRRRLSGLGMGGGLPHSHCGGVWGFSTRIFLKITCYLVHSGAIWAPIWNLTATWFSITKYKYSYIVHIYTCTNKHKLKETYLIHQTLVKHCLP